MIELKNIELYNNNQKAIFIDNENIVQQPNKEVANTIKLNFNNAIAFPGLINSHEHLDYNLLPQFKTEEYTNYIEWSNSLTKHFQPQIDSIRNVPEELSTQWGVYKNLLNGVTHVVNHGPTFKLKDPIITLIENCYWLHSIKFHYHWKRFLINPFKKNLPIAIHIAEGTDLQSKEEANYLFRWNVLRKKLIAVHGVALDKNQAKKFKALIWCPASNFHLFNKTSNISELKQEVKMLFGTDSTLTAGWSIWEHLKMALGTNMVNKNELYEMITTTPSLIWKVPQYGLKINDLGNLVIAKKNAEEWLDSFFEIRAADILLVMCKGQINLFDESLLGQLSQQGFNTKGFSYVTISGSKKYVFGDLPDLAKKIKFYCKEVEFPFTV